MAPDGELGGGCLAPDPAAGCGEVAAQEEGGAVARPKSLARIFQWLFPCRFRWFFPIKQRRDRAAPHGIGDRGDSILPTSPRSIEVRS